MAPTHLKLPPQIYEAQPKTGVNVITVRWTSTTQQIGYFKLKREDYRNDKYSSGRVDITFQRFNSSATEADLELDILFDDSKAQMVLTLLSFDNDGVLIGESRHYIIGKSVSRCHIFC